MKAYGKYNTVKIHNTQKSIKKIDLEGRYSNFSINMENSFDLDFEGEKAGLNIPSEFVKKVWQKEDSDIRVVGSHGNSRTGTKILARLEYGSLSLK